MLMLDDMPDVLLWLMLLPDEVDMVVELAGAVVDCASASADDVASNAAANAKINDMRMKNPSFDVSH